MSKPVVLGQSFGITPGQLAKSLTGFIVHIEDPHDPTVTYHMYITGRHVEHRIEGVIVGAEDAGTREYPQDDIAG